MMYPSHACVSSIAPYVSLKEEEEEVGEGLYKLQAKKQPPDPPLLCCFALSSGDLPTCVLLLLFFFLFSTNSVYAF